MDRRSSYIDRRLQYFYAISRHLSPEVMGTPCLSVDKIFKKELAFLITYTTHCECFCLSMYVWSYIYIYIYIYIHTSIICR